MERFFRTLCNPYVFRTQSYLEPEEYSESCQASMVQHFFKNLVLCNPGILRILNHVHNTLTPFDGCVSFPLTIRKLGSIKKILKLHRVIV